MANRFTGEFDKQYSGVRDNGEQLTNFEVVDLLNENEQLKDEVYNEIDNALTVLKELYEVSPLNSQKKMNQLYNRLESLREELK